MTTMWESRDIVRFVEIYMIFDTSDETFSILCENCDLCDAYKMEKLEHVPASKIEPQLNVLEIKNRFNKLPDFSIAVPSDVDSDVDCVKLEKSRYILERIAQVQSMDNFKLVDTPPEVHMLSILISDNVTLKSKSFWDDSGYYWDPVDIPACPNVWFRSASRPGLSHNSKAYFNEFQNTGLITRIKTLRFVCCHKERPSWLSNVKEIVSAFDLCTWILLLVSLAILATSIIKIAVTYRRFIKPTRYLINVSFTDVVYRLFVSLLEQGSGLFHNSNLKANGCISAVIFCLSLLFNIMSNAYKGENINRLTVEPPLTPFEDYKDLLKHNFSIFTMSREYNFKYARVEYHANNLYEQINDHEAFPVVSQLWHRYNLKKTTGG